MVCNDPLGNSLIAVLTAYFDASKTEVSLGVTSIVGYVAPLPEWERVEAEWLRAEKDWKLDRFHLTDLPRLIGHEKTPQCIGYFSEIIRNSKLVGLGPCAMGC